MPATRSKRRTMAAAADVDMSLLPDGDGPAIGDGSMTMLMDQSLRFSPVKGGKRARKGLMPQKRKSFQQNEEKQGQLDDLDDAELSRLAWGEAASSGPQEGTAAKHEQVHSPFSSPAGSQAQDLPLAAFSPNVEVRRKRSPRKTATPKFDTEGWSSHDDLAADETLAAANAPLPEPVKRPAPVAHVASVSQALPPPASKLPTRAKPRATSIAALVAGARAAKASSSSSSSSSSQHQQQEKKEGREERRKRLGLDVPPATAATGSTHQANAASSSPAPSSPPKRKLTSLLSFSPSKGKNIAPVPVGNLDRAATASSSSDLMSSSPLRRKEKRQGPERSSDLLSLMGKTSSPQKHATAGVARTTASAAAEPTAAVERFSDIAEDEKEHHRIEEDIEEVEEVVEQETAAVLEGAELAEVEMELDATSEAQEQDDLEVKDDMTAEEAIDEQEGGERTSIHGDAEEAEQELDVKAEQFDEHVEDDVHVPFAVPQQEPAAAGIEEVPSPAAAIIGTPASSRPRRRSSRLSSSALTGSASTNDLATALSQAETKVAIESAAVATSKPPATRRTRSSMTHSASTGGKSSRQAIAARDAKLAVAESKATRVYRERKAAAAAAAAAEEAREVARPATLSASADMSKAIIGSSSPAKRTKVTRSAVALPAAKEEAIDAKPTRRTAGRAALGKGKAGTQRQTASRAGSANQSTPTDLDVPAGYRVTSTGQLVPTAASSTATVPSASSRTRRTAPVASSVSYTPSAAHFSSLLSATEASATSSSSRALGAGDVPAYLARRREEVQREVDDELARRIEKARRDELARSGARGSSSRFAHLPPALMGPKGSSSSSRTAAPAPAPPSALSQRLESRRAWETSRRARDALVEAERAAAREERERLEAEELRKERERRCPRANPVPEEIYGTVKRERIGRRRE
ncbi:hypothetical protein BDZ90DRAFT_112931 [Jaminaea rosea]|uniref:TPX2 C-terminal domain-containing protein n=1 Tax=Jaminaea rosea TaxID=1569628 RepID=A0A316V036_9BASI|nr:hypothetical protein BDZ90DRAFT_112931 [Jaminaea rosea]PWN29533.1 hypothetical protein BDZ90DRAFT_112931 [Jaminaea rosea]